MSARSTQKDSQEKPSRPKSTSQKSETGTTKASLASMKLKQESPSLHVADNKHDTSTRATTTKKRKTAADADSTPKKAKRTDSDKQANKASTKEEKKGAASTEVEKKVVSKPVKEGRISTKREDAREKPKKSRKKDNSASSGPEPSPLPSIPNTKKTDKEKAPATPAPQTSKGKAIATKASQNGKKSRETGKKSTPKIAVDGTSSTTASTAPSVPISTPTAPVKRGKSRVSLGKTPIFGNPLSYALPDPSRPSSFPFLPVPAISALAAISLLGVRPAGSEKELFADEAVPESNVDADTGSEIGASHGKTATHQKSEGDNPAVDAVFLHTSTDLEFIPARANPRAKPPTGIYEKIPIPVSSGGRSLHLVLPIPFIPSLSTSSSSSTTLTSDMCTASIAPPSPFVSSSLLLEVTQHIRNLPLGITVTPRELETALLFHSGYAACSPAYYLSEMRNSGKVVSAESVSKRGKVNVSASIVRNTTEMPLLPLFSREMQHYHASTPYTRVSVTPPGVYPGYLPPLPEIGTIQEKPFFPGPTPILNTLLTRLCLSSLYLRNRLKWAVSEFSVGNSTSLYRNMPDSGMNNTGVNTSYFLTHLSETGKEFKNSSSFSLSLDGLQQKLGTSTEISALVDCPEVASRLLPWAWVKTIVAATVSRLHDVAVARDCAERERLRTKASEVDEDGDDEEDEDREEDDGYGEEDEDRDEDGDSEDNEETVESGDGNDAMETQNKDKDQQIVSLSPSGLLGGSTAMCEIRARAENRAKILHKSELFHIPNPWSEFDYMGFCMPGEDAGLIHNFRKSKNSQVSKQKKGPSRNSHAKLGIPATFPLFHLFSHWEGRNPFTPYVAESEGSMTDEDGKIPGGALSEAYLLSGTPYIDFDLLPVMDKAAVLLLLCQFRSLTKEARDFLEYGQNMDENTEFKTSVEKSPISATDLRGFKLGKDSRGVEYVWDKENSWRLYCFRDGETLINTNSLETKKLESKKDETVRNRSKTSSNTSPLFDKSHTNSVTDTASVQVPPKSSSLQRSPPKCWLAAASEVEIRALITALNCGTSKDVALAGKLKERLCFFLNCSIRDAEIRARLQIREETEEEMARNSQRSKASKAKTIKPREIAYYTPEDQEHLGYAPYFPKRTTRLSIPTEQRRGSARLVEVLISRLEAERTAKEKLNTQAYRAGVREKRALLEWVRDMYDQVCNSK